MTHDTNQSRSKVISSDNFQWEGITRKQYKTDDTTFKGVHRYTLLGPGDDEQALNFETRYFEVESGGYTSLEYHRHPHSVVVVRGQGSVIIEDKLYDISPHDAIFIAPDTIHQFHAGQDTPLGFICIVDRYRDRPTLPTEQDLDHIDNDRVLSKMKR